MLTYPTTLEDAPTVLLTNFVNSNWASPEVVNAAWHVLGFSLRQIYPNQPTIGESIAQLQDVTLLSDDEMKEALKSLEAHGDRVQAATGMIFPWAGLAATLLNLLLKLIVK